MKYIPRKRFRKWWTRSGTYEYRWRVNWLDFRHCSYIYHSPRVFHPLAMLSTSQKDTPFSCLAMVGLNSLLVRAVARTYNSPSWTRHAFLRLISNSLSRRCTVYTSLIITRVRFYLITIIVIEPCIARETERKLGFLLIHGNLFFTSNDFLSLNFYDEYEVWSEREKRSRMISTALVLQFYCFCHISNEISENFSLQPLVNRYKISPPKL